MEVSEMACPYCGVRNNYHTLDIIETDIDDDGEYVDVYRNAVCNNCGKKFVEVLSFIDPNCETIRMEVWEGDEDWEGDE